MPFRKILAIKLRALGDTVLMTAPLSELRRAYPRAEIHVVALAPWAPLLEAHPAINQIWSYERHADRTTRAKALARLAFRLRRERFDCVVNFHASPSSSILAYSIGARTRSIHFHGHRARNRHSTVTIPGKGTLKPVIERDMDAIRALGISVPEGRLPSIPITAEEKKAAQTQLHQLGLKQPLLGLGLGASRPTKSWPIERYAELAIRWCQSRGGSVLAITGPTEHRLADDFLHLVRGSASAEIASQIRAESKKSIRETAALLSQGSVFAGNDSGPKHLAIAVGTPTVTLFGPEHPFEWHPYPKDLHPYFFIDHLPCRKDADPGMPPWCGLHDCVQESHRCMRSITVDPVLAECERICR